MKTFNLGKETITTTTIKNYNKEPGKTSVLLLSKDV